MIGLLAHRTLGNRPKRTAFFLLGFGISVGVMITLLSIGEAVLEQARDRDLVGGGDLVLLPEGIDVEVMKVGGATGMFFGIDQARFVYRQVLSGPRYAGWMASVPAPGWPGQAPAPPLAAASPGLVGKVVYGRRIGGGAPRRLLATGVIPSLHRRVGGAPRGVDGAALDWQDSHADRLWMEPPVDSLYNGFDRFHLPPAGQPDLERWAEWLYFNFSMPAGAGGGGGFGFVSLIAAGDIAAGRGVGLSQLQLARPGRAPRKFAGKMVLRPGDLSTERVDLRFGATRARFADGAWRLHLDWASALGPVRGDLVVRPVLDLYYPPFLIHASERFVSGYTVPAIRAVVSGALAAGGERVVLRDAPAYHDHNWGTWRNVHWDWGTAGTAEYGLFYGRVEHPELRPGTSGAGLFVMLSQARSAGRRGGFLGLFRPRSIDYAWRDAPPLPGRPARVPAHITMRSEPDGGGPPGASDGDAIEVEIDVDEVVANEPQPGEAQVFLQLRGQYRVRARLGDRDVAFEAPGFAEVFVPRR